MRRAILILVAAVGAALTAAGAWLSVTLLRPATGWTAFAPRSGDVYVVTVGEPWWTIAMVVTGALALATAVALLVVQRRG